MPVPGKHSPLRLYRMDKGRGIGNIPKEATHQLRIKPDAGQPCGQIGEQSTANAANRRKGGIVW